MTSPQKFLKVPVEIEAFQWDGTAEGATPIIEWVLSGGGSVNYYCHHDMGCPGTVEGHVLMIQTLEGRMQASPLDWIIRGVANEFYPCKPDIFAVTYEASPIPDRVRCAGSSATVVSNLAIGEVTMIQCWTCHRVVRVVDGEVAIHWASP